MDGEGGALTPFAATGTCYIADMAKKRIRPSDLPTKRVTAPDGTVVQMKVVKADSPTLEFDLLAAFRSNVRRIKDDQRRRARVEANAAQA